MLLLCLAFASTPWRKNTLYNEWSHKWTPIPSVCKMICSRRQQRSLIGLPLISLWIFFSECRYSRPFRISLRMVAIWVSSRAPGSIFQETRTETVEAKTIDGFGVAQDFRTNTWGQQLMWWWCFHVNAENRRVGLVSNTPQRFFHQKLKHNPFHLSVNCR